MKKIKKFKVRLRKREIIHNLKLNTQIQEITPQIEEVILKEIEKSEEYLSPASVFDTFSPDAAEKNFDLEFEQESKPVAVSVVVVTVGSAIEKEIECAKQRGEKLHSDIIQAIGLEACDSSINFIYRILNEEAREEEYSLMPIEKTTGDFEKNIVRKSDTKKINVYIDDKNQIQPPYSSVAIVRWLPTRKKTK